MPDCGAAYAFKVADFAQEKCSNAKRSFLTYKKACQNRYWVTSICFVVKMPFSQSVHTKYLRMSKLIVIYNPIKSGIIII